MRGEKEHTGRAFFFVTEFLVLSLPLGLGSGLLRGARLFLYFGIRHDRTGRGRAGGKDPKGLVYDGGTAKKRRRQRRRI